MKRLPIECDQLPFLSSDQPQRQRARFSAALLIVASILLSTPEGRPAAQVGGGSNYVLVDISPPAGLVAIPNAISNGTIVGHTSTGRAILWVPNTHLTHDLHPAGPFPCTHSAQPATCVPLSSSAIGINGDQILLNVGVDVILQNGHVDRNRSHAVLLTPSGLLDMNGAQTETLFGGIFGGGTTSAPGMQVGHSRDRGRALLWFGAPASIVDLHPGGDEHSAAFATDGVQQVGAAYSPSINSSRAALWTGSAASFRSLHPPGFTMSWAHGVRSGQQVGRGVTAFGAQVALLWRGTAESVVNLGAGFVNGTNGLRQVGGIPPLHAAVWSGSAASLEDLNPPGFRSSEARAIDANGDIIGWGIDSTGKTRALLWMSSGGSDISIAKETTMVTQAIFDPDFNRDTRIDLVSGKPAVVRTVVKGTAVDPNDNRQLTIEASLEGTVVATATFPIGLLSNATSGMTIYLPEFTPTGSGDANLTITVDPGNQFLEADETNNSVQLLSTLKLTRQLYIQYVKIRCEGLSPEQALFADTVAKAGAYIAAQFPVAPAQFRNVSTQPELECDQNFDKDDRNLSNIGKLLSNNLATKTVGLVESNWMSTRVAQLNLPPSNGLAKCGGLAAFVLTGRWDTVSHELGHTFLLDHPGVSACGSQAGSSGPTDSYWVQYGVSNATAESLMAGGTALPVFPKFVRWITKPDYEHLFRSSLANPQSDPELLIVSGIIHTDGRIDGTQFFRISSGVADESANGDFSVKVLDGAGRVLTETVFGLSFVIPADEPIKRDSAAFSLAVPFPVEATTVQVTQKGRTVLAMNIGEKLLRDAVASIPDYGFKTNPAQRRNALLQKIDAFERGLSPTPGVGTRQKLANDIRKDLEDWLIDGYLVDSPLRYTKAGLLELVDALLRRLSP